MDQATLARLKDQKLSRLRSQIVDVMDEHDITFNKNDFTVHSCTKPKYLGGANVQQILVLKVTIADMETTDKLSKARRAIGALLSGYGLDHIKVELLDEKRAFLLTLLPIHPSSNAVRVYDFSRNDIIGLLHSELAMSWVTVSLYRIHKPGVRVAAAVVVMVRPYTKSNWQSLKYQINNIIKRGYETLKMQSHARTPVEVEFIPGRSGALPDAADQDPAYESIGSAKDLIWELTPWPKMGDGLGIHGTTGGGTLGGFFKLKVHGAEIKGLLTNYHVTDPFVQKPDRHADEYGVSYNDAAYSTQLSFPIKDDVDVTLKQATKIKLEYETAIKNFRDQKDEDSAIGKSTRGLEKQISASQTIIDSKIRIENLCEVRPKVFGDVLISSGRALGPKQDVLDWAFVQCADRATWEGPSRIKDMNTLPLASRFVGSIARLDLGQSGSTTYNNLDPLAQIEGFSDMVKGKWYFKLGRTSDISTGICNGTEVHTNISHTRQCYDEQGRPKGIVFCKTSVDYMILNGVLREGAEESDKHGVPFHQDFCTGGDSGSLIIDTQGCCAGLLYGSLHGSTSDLNQWSTDYQRAGTVTTMSSVRHSIETKTTLVRRVTGRDREGKEIAQVTPSGPRGELCLAHL